jgi:glycosyltransferase involved in cell wall biosynthesis
MTAKADHTIMRVVHLSSLDSHGGAFRGTAWLNQALRRHGVDSHMLVARKHTDDPTVHLPTNYLLSRLQHIWGKYRERQALAAYPNRAPAAMFSPAIVSANLRPAFRRLKPDIIHIHWVGFGFVRPEDLETWRCPIVWTLRDMWAFTGGCHYAGDCDRYLDQCGACPQLGSTAEQDLSRDLWSRKHWHWPDADLTLVAISHWLADCARQSSLLSRRPTYVIPNAIDDAVFQPSEKTSARAQLGLPQDKRIVLYGAYGATTDTRKGYPYLIQALEHLVSADAAQDIFLTVFGADAAPEGQTPQVQSIFVGTIMDDRILATLYSAADVMVVPSVQDAFGKTAAEAMACGTPVVSFDTTGLKDIVEHRRTGYRARCFDLLDLAEGIRWVLSDPERHKALSARAIAKVKEEFTMERVANRYIELYQTILAGRSAN